MVRFLSFLIIAVFPIAIAISMFLILTNNSFLYIKLMDINKVFVDSENPALNRIAAASVHSYLFKNGNLQNKFFSTQAIAHLKDVKNLIAKVKILTLIIDLIVLGALTVLLKFNVNFLLKTLHYASVVLIISTVASLLSTLIGFSRLFIIFHKIAFTNNLWLFDKDDNLIKLFPEQLFFNYFLLYLISLFIVGFTLILSLKFFLRK